MHAQLVITLMACGALKPVSYYAPYRYPYPYQGIGYPIAVTRPRNMLEDCPKGFK